MFLQVDVLREEVLAESTGPPPLLAALKNRSKDGQLPRSDILISNPPYISSKDYSRTTYRSVRDFEPKLALVPPTANSQPSQYDGDLFYPRLLRIAEQMDTKILLIEVADLKQADRVASIAVEQGIWDGIQVWRDDPADRSATAEVAMVNGDSIPVVGSGHGRSVFAYRGEGTAWLGI